MIINGQVWNNNINLLVRNNSKAAKKFQKNKSIKIMGE